MKKICDDPLYDLLPQSIKKDTTIRTASESIKAPYQTICNHRLDALIMARIDELPSAVLDHLATQWRAAVWRDTWDVEVKRNALKTLIIEKRFLGTRRAIENALSSVGAGAYITEWWEMSPQGTPHTFEIVVNQNDLGGTISADQTNDIKRMIDYAKPERSQYTFTVMQKTEAEIRVYGGATALTFARIRSDEKLKVEAKGAVKAYMAILPITVARVR